MRRRWRHRAPRRLPTPRRCASASLHSPGAGALFIAADRYFKDAGVDARLEFLATDALVAAGVAAGRLDIGVGELDAPFFTYAATNGLVFLASAFSDQTGYPANALLIGKKAHDAGLRAVQDLPHKRIGMTAPGAGVHYSLERILARYRIDPGTVTRVWLKTPAAEIAAVSRGSVDAAILPYATALTLKQAGKAAAIIRLSDLNQWQEGVIFARAATIAARRPAVAAFMRAYLGAAADYDLTFQQRGDEGDVLPGPHYVDYLRLIGRQARLKPELVERTLHYCDRLARLDVTDIERQLAFWQDQGLVAKSLAAPDLLDLSFIGEPIR